MDSHFQKWPLRTAPRFQTGTVGALLHNIRLYDALPEDATIKREELEKNLELAIPTLANVGFFGLFGPDEWLAGSSKRRRYVGQKAKDLGI